MEMNYNTLYHQKLINLGKDQIIPYANTVFEQANLLYEKELANKSWWNNIRTNVFTVRNGVALGASVLSLIIMHKIMITLFPDQATLTQIMAQYFRELLSFTEKSSNEQKRQLDIIMGELIKIVNYLQVNHAARMLPYLTI